ncbi:MAG: hypothetical protein GEV09_24205, partial [Pseudonocardiaceae bacterium]|nr:hypothetical protein [Pseudonocardiaceae bacterium]
MTQSYQKFSKLSIWPLGGCPPHRPGGGRLVVLAAPSLPCGASEEAAVTATTVQQDSPARALVDPRTWLATVHLLAGFLVGTVAFPLVLTALVLSVGLLPLFLLGVPVFLGAVALVGGLAQFERGRHRLLLGADIPGPTRPQPPRGLFARAWRLLCSGRVWCQIGYFLLVRFVLGIVSLVLVLAVWSVPLAMLALPLFNWALPNGGAEFGILQVTGLQGALVVAALGFVLLLAAPAVVRGLAAADAVVARAMLGPGPTELRARVEQLERSRARVVDAGEAERRRIE